MSESMRWYILSGSMCGTGCIYPYFFDMEADGALILDTLDDMYKSQSIQDFMRNSYSYCQKHETEIRNHILRKEQS